MARRGGLGPRGAAWVREAAHQQVHEAEIVTGQIVPPGTPALLTVPEAVDVLAVLEAAITATPAGPVRDRVVDLAGTLRQRLRDHTP